MRRARATTPLAATVLLLMTACATPPVAADDPTVADGATLASEPAATPITSSAGVEVDGDLVLVTADESAAWELRILESGPVPSDALTTFDGAPSPSRSSTDEHVVWVCMEATQLAGEPGAWISDDVRVEVWATPDGPRYDDLTGFAYAPADAAVDVYEASGHDIGEPYERICPIFVVPADVDGSTIAVVPNGGEPAVLEH
jgi:hypothetical protein